MERDGGNLLVVVISISATAISALLALEREKGFVSWLFPSFGHGQCEYSGHCTPMQGVACMYMYACKE